MVDLIRKILRDKRGNALAIAAASLPLVIGSAGLASDTIQWTLWKRQVQRTADSAALAGVYALAQSKDATSAATRDIAVNSHVGFALTSTSIQPPPTSGPYAGDTDAVRVTLTAKKSLSFSSMFTNSAPTITATATAKLVNDGDYCVVALKKTGSALKIGGSSNVRMGCGAISNSTDPIESVGVMGNAHHFEADPVAGAGGMPSTINGVTDIDPYHSPLPDPFANKYPTNIPSGLNCTNSNHPTKSNADGSMRPGCYNNFNIGNGTTTLSPGVYYLNSTNLSLNGQQRLVGTGVTIILTGSSPGSITMNGNSSISLIAPTDATCGTYYGTNTCNYKEMLLIQAANATADNMNKINGDNSSFYDGAMYFPNGQVQFLGSSSQATKCAMVVASIVDFSGNTDIQNDTAGCTADQQVSAKSVRLVA